VRDWDLESSAGGYLVFPASFVEETIFFSNAFLGSFVKNQMALDAWACIWVFCSMSLVPMSVFVPIPWCFYYHGSAV
jgi:hypothetical protein